MPIYKGSSGGWTHDKPIYLHIHIDLRQLFLCAATNDDDDDETLLNMLAGV